MSRYIDADELLHRLPDDLPYKASVKRVLMQAPSVDVVEVRHGEWLPQYEGSRLSKCSVCGYEYCDLIECRNYCGNCGAKMDGRREE